MKGGCTLRVFVVNPETEEDWGDVGGSRTEGRGSTCTLSHPTGASPPARTSRACEKWDQRKTAHLPV